MDVIQRPPMVRTEPGQAWAALLRDLLAVSFLFFFEFLKTFLFLLSRNECKWSVLKSWPKDAPCVAAAIQVPEPKLLAASYSLSFSEKRGQMLEAQGK